MTEHERVYEVELYRAVFDDPDDPVSWAAEWAPRGSNSATEDNSEDLAELVAAVIADARAFAGRCGGAVRIDWQLSGDAPPGSTVAAAVSAEGITLPEQVQPA